MAMMVELDVRNPSGLHARPAAVFVKAASGFGSEIRVANLTTASGDVSAKSIIAVLGLGVQRGHRIRLRCEGGDEHAAMKTLQGLVEAGLDEALDEVPPSETPPAAPVP